MAEERHCVTIIDGRVSGEDRARLIAVYGAEAAGRIIADEEARFAPPAPAKPKAAAPAPAPEQE